MLFTANNYLYISFHPINQFFAAKHLLDVFIQIHCIIIVRYLPHIKDVRQISNLLENLAKVRQDSCRKFSQDYIILNQQIHLFGLNS